MRKLLRMMGWLLGFIAGIVGLLLLLSVVGMWIPTRGLRLKAEGDVRIYIYSNGLHTDFILPTDFENINWATQLDSNRLGKYQKYAFTTFGWGERDFFVNSRDGGTVGGALKALFWANPSVMHIGFKKYKPIETDRCIALTISREQYKRLADFIKAQFTLQKSKKTLFVANGYGENDFFYEGEGKYYCLHTCNNWTNRGIKKMGIRTGIWTPFDWGVLYYLKKAPYLERGSQ
jgi:uncharacterized protein (TIGR02117 family)